MRKKNMNVSCVSCGKHELEKDEIGINIKLLGEQISSYYCLECLADYLEVTVDDLNAKIEAFKDEGCTLFG